MGAGAYPAVIRREAGPHSGQVARITQTHTGDKKKKNIHTHSHLSVVCD